MSHYRSAFFNASDQPAYTAIRSKVDGTSEYIAQVGAEPSNTLSAGVDFTNKYDGPGGGMVG